MADDNELDFDLARSRLQPERRALFRPEEEIRRWSIVPVASTARAESDSSHRPVVRMLWDKPLLRIWDSRSGSQPNGQNRLQARASHMRLDSRSVRVDTLGKHHSHRERTPTPYISFKSWPSDLQHLANDRVERGRGEQSLTVINPRQRFRLGLPILHYQSELIHYEIDDPYGSGHQLHEQHFLCLWEVTPAEVVGTWSVSDLLSNQNWYEDVIMPAYRDHVRNMIERPGNAIGSRVPNAISTARVFSVTEPTLVRPVPTRRRKRSHSDSPEEEGFDTISRDRPDEEHTIPWEDDFEGDLVRKFERRL